MFKKKLASMMAVLAVMSMTTANLAFAADEVVAPSANDRASIVVKNVEADATVKAYQVVEGVYNSQGIIRFEQTAASKSVQKIEDIEKIKDTDVTKLSRWLYGGADGIKEEDVLTLEYDKANKTYFTNKAEAGSYIVIVEASDASYIYNPMYVSNDYKDANNAATLGQKDKNGNDDADSANGKVDATAENAMISSRQGVAYAKKSHTELDKDIIDSSTGSTEVEDVQVGDTVTMEIYNTTPDYSEAFTTITYRIKDTQMKGLDVVKAENVSVMYIDDEGERQGFDKDDYVLAIDEKNNCFTVDFASKWLKANPVRGIVIRYSTTVNENADKTYLTTVNRAELTYSSLPTDETGHLEDTVQYYTFEGTAFKIAEDGTLVVDDNKNVVVTKALQGATFELTGVTTPVMDAGGDIVDKDISDRVYTMTTGEDGKISFSGLDAGVYRMRETKAPDGMFLTDNIYTVIITPTYGEDKGEGAELMDSYTVEIYRSDKLGNKVAEADGTQVDVVSKYVFDKAHLNAYLAPTANAYNPDDYWDYFSAWTDDNFKNEVLANEATVINALGVVNQRLSKLPSTGGAGTFAFTIVGSVLGLGGAYVLLSKKRKEEKSE